jgi:hypothetical protein
MWRAITPSFNEARLVLQAGKLPSWALLAGP